MSVKNPFTIKSYQVEVSEISNVSGFYLLTQIEHSVETGYLAYPPKTLLKQQQRDHVSDARSALRCRTCSQIAIKVTEPMV